MRRAAKRHRLLIGCFVACLVRPVSGSDSTWEVSAVSADAPSVVERAARARELGHLGLAAYAERRWGDALRYFTDAEAWMHSPVFVLYMARCQQELGAIDRARALYHQAAEEPLGDEAPAAWREAQASAGAALQDLDASYGASQEEAAPPEPPSAESEGPGRAAPNTSSPTGPSSPSSPRPSSVSLSLDDELPPYRFGAYTALGVGVVGLATGVVAGSMAWSQAAEIKSRCDGTSCLASDEARAQDTRRLAHVATVGFVVAATGAVVGITLWLLPSTSERGLAVRVGPAAASITGRF